MQITSLIAAVIVAAILGTLNAFIGLSYNYDLTSLVFFVFLPLGTALLGAPAGFAAGWFDKSHKGQNASLPILWGVLGGVATIATYFGVFFVQTGAADAGMTYIDFIKFMFENGYDSPLLGYLEIAAAAFGGFVGAGIGIGASRTSAGTSRMPYHFDSVADVLVAMIGIDGSIDQDEKDMASIGLQISLADWFDEPDAQLQAKIRDHSQNVINAKTAKFGTGKIDLDAQLAKLKSQGDKVINATCISVFAVAAADDVIDPAEEKLLYDILSKLGKPESDYATYLAISKQLVAAVKPSTTVNPQTNDVIEDIVEDGVT